MKSSLDRLRERIEAIPNEEIRSYALEYFDEEEERVKVSTMKTQFRVIIALSEFLGERPLGSLTRRDVVQFIKNHRGAQGQHLTKKRLEGKPLGASTRHQWSVYIRKYIAWTRVFGRHPEFLDALPFPRKTEVRKEIQKKILTLDEFRALIDAATNLRDKALLIFLTETGYRSSEAASIQLQDVLYFRSQYWIRLREEAEHLKTGTRDVLVPVIAGKEIFEAWLQEHPTPSNPEAPLFPSISNRNHGEPVTGSALSQVVARCSKRAGIKHTTGHVLRHQATSWKVAQGWNPEIIRLQMGWSKKSNMLQHYTHVESDFEAMILKEHGIETFQASQADILGAMPCPTCGDIQPVWASRCRNCHQANRKELREAAVKALDEQIEALRKQRDELADTNDPESA